MLLSLNKVKVVLLSVDLENGCVFLYNFRNWGLRQIRLVLGLTVSLSRLVFRGIAIFHSLRSRIYTLPSFAFPERSEWASFA